MKKEGSTIKDIARATKTNYSQAYRIIRKYIEIGVCKPVGKKGRETLFVLSDKYTQIIFGTKSDGS